MKILFVLENYFPHIGGVEVLFKNLCEGLAKRGHNVNLVTHRIKGTKRYEIINKVHIYRVDCFHNRYAFTFFSIPKVLKLAKKADIIHTTTFNGAPPAWIAARLRRIPVVITVHEVWIGRWSALTGMNRVSAGIHNLLERLIYLVRYNRYICVSESTKNSLIKIQKDVSKITVIYNGVEYEHFNPKKYKEKAEKIRNSLDLKKKFVYLCYGRPGVSKGIEYAIGAVPYISKKIENSRMLLILSRDSAYRKRYEFMMDLIDKLNIKDKIILLEPRSFKELPGYLMSADCVVVPSIVEGFGYTAAEACAMGKSVVASDTTSLPEVVSGKYVLVEPRNPEAIANGVVKVYKKKVRDSGSKRFYWKSNIEKTEKLYESFINKTESL